MAQHPYPTVDIIIEMNEKIVLIQRKYEPLGLALPGGFVDYGESLEAAAIREAKEETSLDVTLKYQLKTYSDPRRDARRHTTATAFVAEGKGTLCAADDAQGAKFFSREEIPKILCFDHKQILDDYYRFKDTGELPRCDLHHA